MDMNRERERKKETFRRQRHHQSLTDNGVDAETSLSFFLSLSSCPSLFSALFSRAHYWVNKYILKVFPSLRVLCQLGNQQTELLQYVKLIESLGSNLIRMIQIPELRTSLVRADCRDQDGEEGDENWIEQKIEKDELSSEL